MPFNCLIIDDNYKKGQGLKMLLDAQPLVGNVLNTIHPYQINAHLLNEDIDVVLIRIGLWEHRLFVAVYALKKKPKVIFISSGNEKYWADERNSALDILHEPFDGKAIHVLLSSYLSMKQYAFDWNFFFVKHDRRFNKIDFEDLLLVENKPNSCYIMLHTKKAKYLVKDNMEDMLEKLPKEDFLRISDELIIPFENKQLVQNDSYVFEGDIIQLTYRYLKQKERSEAVEATEIE